MNQLEAINKRSLIHNGIFDLVFVMWGESETGEMVALMVWYVHA